VIAIKRMLNQIIVVARLIGFRVDQI